MHQNHELLMMGLTRFFSKPEHIEPVVCIVKGTSDISLRLIDWFITNYAKKNNSIAVTNDSTQFNIYHSYRTQLKTYSKHQFDPFRRHERIRFVYGDNERGEIIETTVGQLNFFRWAIENNIISYIRENKKDIEEAMVKSGAVAASSSKEKGSSEILHRCKTTVSFD
ncbi:hypothetical protein TetV_249 [Tetraselmis virus 1]|uniref:Uncharacterized protein n=1 Tax=Tetraselmis virus 1 TaxID=2060617 RepID=A0A2P0VN66_9VIRU|nr:hypothetical protein QJ968_gp249 [Tetraselmis virus 1]AUF82341.1 hypothetical protein TetV_249 [Tetraselmis virus 1]